MFWKILKIFQSFTWKFNVLRREENGFFPIKCVISQGGGVRSSVIKCEKGGRGGLIPEKGVISYLNAPLKEKRIRYRFCKIL